MYVHVKMYGPQDTQHFGPRCTNFETSAVILLQGVANLEKKEKFAETPWGFEGQTRATDRQTDRQDPHSDNASPSCDHNPERWWFQIHRGGVGGDRDGAQLRDRRASVGDAGGTKASSGTDAATGAATGAATSAVTGAAQRRPAALCLRHPPQGRGGPQPEP